MLQKPYIHTIQIHEAMLNGIACVVLDVHYHSVYSARFHAGRQQITNFIGESGIYLGTTANWKHQQYWYQIVTPTIHQSVLDIIGPYDGEPIIQPPYIPAR